MCIKGQWQWQWRWRWPKPTTIRPEPEIITLFLLQPAEESEVGGHLSICLSGTMSVSGCCVVQKLPARDRSPLHSKASSYTFRSLSEYRYLKLNKVMYFFNY